MASVDHILMLAFICGGEVRFDNLNGYLHSSHLVTFLVLIHCSKLPLVMPA
jgi:hypothetical protein